MLEPGLRLVGQTETITFTAGADQDSVIARTLSPSWIESTYTYGTDAELTKPSTGVYTLTIAPDMGGRWYVQFKGTKNGVVQILEEILVVRTSPFEDGANRAYS